MGRIISLLGAGSSIRAWATGAMIGALVLLGLALGVQEYRIAAVHEDLGIEKASRKTAEQTAKDNFAAFQREQSLRRLNEGALQAMMARSDASHGQVKVEVRKVYVERKIPVPVVEACGPVLDAFNSDLDGLRRVIGGGDPQGGDAAAGHPADPALRPAGPAGVLRQP